MNGDLERQRSGARDESWIGEYLADLEKRNLFRETRVSGLAGGKWLVDGRTLLNFGSNDYLDLATNPSVKASAISHIEKFGCGSGSSRLVSGTFECHVELERRIASLVGAEACIVFSSGHAANTGTIGSIVGRGDVVLVDRLSHASILDGVIQSRADMCRFEHNNPADLEKRLQKVSPTSSKLIVTESVFSMDGDVAPLREIAEVAGRCGAMLMIDEAHATGVFGPGGGGIAVREGIGSDVNIHMGTLSKALGSQGGFVCGSAAVRSLLVNRARSFVYSTALSPAAVGAALGAIEWLAGNPGSGVDLLTRAGEFRRRLKNGGLDTGNSASQIVPVIVGSEAAALALSERLRTEGIFVPAIRPPTVPAGTARLRFSVTLAHTEADLSYAADVVVRCAKNAGVR